MNFNTCKKCGKTLPFSEFVKHPNCKNGIRNICKQCNRKYAKRKSRKYREIQREEREQENTDWKPLPYEVLEKMSDKEHKKYCDAWCKQHPLDLEKLAERLVVGMGAVMDNMTHNNAVRGLD